MIKNKYVVFILHIVMVAVFWTLLDWLYTVYITRGSYQFSAGRDLALPVIIGAVSGWLFYLKGREKELRPGGGEYRQAPLPNTKKTVSHQRETVFFVFGKMNAGSDVSDEALPSACGHMDQSMTKPLTDCRFAHIQNRVFSCGHCGHTAAASGHSSIETPGTTAGNGTPSHVKPSMSKECFFS